MSDLSRRAAQLLAAVVRQADDVETQIALCTLYARNYATSQREVDSVKELLRRGRVGAR